MSGDLLREAFEGSENVDLARQGYVDARRIVARADGLMADVADNVSFPGTDGKFVRSGSIPNSRYRGSLRGESLNELGLYCLSGDGGVGGYECSSCDAVIVGEPELRRKTSLQQFHYHCGVCDEILGTVTSPRSG